MRVVGQTLSRQLAGGWVVGRGLPGTGWWVVGQHGTRTSGPQVAKALGPAPCRAPTDAIISVTVQAKQSLRL